MIEFTEHEAYRLLTTKYPRVCLDYVILLENGKYAGLESHKQAVLEAFKLLNERFAAYDYQVDVKANKMQGKPITAAALLQSPPKDYDQQKRRGNRSFNITAPLPYWFAFLEPPHGTPYLEADFVAFNNVLFPNKNDLEVYRWNDDFSNYFADGKEWWGTGLWTVFDKKSKLMVVIGASLTD